MHIFAFALGGPEIIILVLIIVLLFGAAKLPALARSSGQALRIFKHEVKELTETDEAKREESTSSEKINHS